MGTFSYYQCQYMSFKKERGGKFRAISQHEQPASACFGGCNWADTVLYSVNIRGTYYLEDESYTLEHQLPEYFGRKWCLTKRKHTKYFLSQEQVREYLSYVNEIYPIEILEQEDNYVLVKIDLPKHNCKIFGLSLTTIIRYLDEKPFYALEILEEMKKKKTFLQCMCEQIVRYYGNKTMKSRVYLKGFAHTQPEGGHGLFYLYHMEEFKKRITQSVGVNEIGTEEYYEAFQFKGKSVNETFNYLLDNALIKE